MKRKVISLDRYRLGKRSNYETRFRELMRAELNKLLDESGFNQTELADKAGVTQSTLSPQLKGERPVTLETLDKIAFACRKSIAQVVKQMSDLALEIPSATERPPAAVMATLGHYQADTPKKSRAQLRKEQKQASASRSSQQDQTASTATPVPASQDKQPRQPAGAKPRR